MTLKQELIKTLRESTGLNFLEERLGDTPDIDLGEYAYPCFELANQEKRPPAELAATLASELGLIKQKLWQTVTAAGPYLNFHLKPEVWGREILQRDLKLSTRKERLLIEYSQPNTHKEFHVGHLRNAVLGASLVNVYRHLGATVIAANYIGDTGMHVAKCLWYLLSHKNILDEEINNPELANEFKAMAIARAYTAANQELESLGAGDSREDNADWAGVTSDSLTQAKASIADIYERLESGSDPELTAIWEKTKQICLQEFDNIYGLLNIKFDEYFFESEEDRAGRELLKDLMQKKLLPEIHESQGAIIADLEKYNLGVLVLIKSDGNVLYGAKDLPLAIKKFNKFKVDKSLYIVDNRQSLYLKQIFKILDLMGYADKEKVHVSYDFVTTSDGAMASRKGNVITARELFYELKQRSAANTTARHPDWSIEKVTTTAEKIALAALKFYLLKYENTSVIVFDFDQALEFDGATGPYLLYARVRLQSILRKLPKRSKLLAPAVDYTLLASREERLLLKELSRFESVVAAVAQKNQPSTLCTYLLELAQKFNTFYHEHSVMDSAPTLQLARRTLLEKVLATFDRGLSLLNIETLEEM